MKTPLKRGLSLLLACAMLCAMAVSAGAAESAVTVTLDGQPLTTQAYADGNGRTQAPAEILERLGVAFDLKAGDSAGDTTVVEGYIPLRYVAEASGFGLSWDSATRTAALTSPAAPAEDAFTKLPNLVYAELEDLMQRQAAKYAAKDNVVPMLWQGLLEMDVAVDGENRTAKLYVPEGTPQGAMFVIMNVPEGQDALTFLRESGWMAKADAEEFCLFVLEPAQGNAWGSTEAEMPYVNAAIGAARAGKWLQPGPSIYLVGYGEIGSDIQRYAMENPIAVAAAVFFDASDISADYMRNNGNVSFDTDTKTYGVTRKEVPVPVLIVGSDAGNVITYWRAAANDPNAVDRFAPEGKAVLDAAVKSDSDSTDYAAPEATNKAWAFLGQFYRYGGGVLSNAISWKVDYDKLGVEFKSFTDSNGIDRQYLVYIPAAYRDGSRKLPVVVAYHGASTSMRNFFENTLWYNIADRVGLMLVFPESTLVPVPGTLGGGEANPTAYRALWQVENPELKLTDATYANDLLGELEKNYSQMDTGRIYCTGHSMGCMMTHYLGSTDVSHRFAAMGATSGPLMAKEDTNAQIIPMFMTFAEYDLWGHDLAQDGSMHNNALDMWLIQNRLATEENVSEVRQNGASETFTEGRYSNYLWKNGQGLTLFRYALVAQKDHVNIPAENELLWDEWFSHWTLGEDGVRSYDSTAIEVPAAVVDETPAQ